MYVYMFLAGLCLHGCTGGLFSSCRDQWLLVVVASLVGNGLWSTQASVVVTYGLSCLEARGILLGPGIEPMFPALAGRFLTTGPPEKSLPSAKKHTLLSSEVRREG